MAKTLVLEMEWSVFTPALAGASTLEIFWPTYQAWGSPSLGSNRLLEKIDRSHNRDSKQIPDAQPKTTAL
jgi:hypothetical protein